MYSPKIKENLVRDLYQLKIATGKPMTKIANNILAKGITKMKTNVNSNKKEESNGFKTD